MGYKGVRVCEETWGANEIDGVRLKEPEQLVGHWSPGGSEKTSVEMEASSF